MLAFRPVVITHFSAIVYTLHDSYGSAGMLAAPLRLMSLQSALLSFVRSVHSYNHCSVPCTERHIHPSIHPSTHGPEIHCQF